MLDKLFKNFHHHWVLGTRAKRAVSGDNYQFTKYGICHIVARLWPRQGALWTSPTSVIMAFRAVGVGQDGFDWELIKSTLYDDGNAVNGEDASGRDLWTTVLNSAVVLTENHRAKLDPAYAELLQRDERAPKRRDCCGRVGRRAPGMCTPLSCSLAALWWRGASSRF